MHFWQSLMTRLRGFMLQAFQKSAPPYKMACNPSQQPIKFNVDDLHRAMDLKDNIRNMSVVGQLGHGKSTLIDSLATAAGIIPCDDDIHMTYTREDEAQRGMTIKSSGISLYYKMTDVALEAFKGERNGNEYLINLIDSPGHVDFSSELTAALRITDGALVVVDCIDGVCIQTRNALRLALGERIPPVLALNKMDRCFLELQVGGEEAYQTFLNVIEEFNEYMKPFEDKVLGDVKVCPTKGNVVFSSGLYGWGFTLSNIAKIYTSISGVDESTWMRKLWGENYYDSKTKAWTTKSTGSATCTRGFVKFCYEPIKKVIEAIMNDQKDQLRGMLTQIGVTMNNEEDELMGEALMKCIMQKWLPIATPLLEMMIFHLPSPQTAQRYRVENLYKGPLDDPYATAIRNCDPDGPLMLYVSKMIPTSDDKSRFFALGRVFAGRISAGLNVRIMGSRPSGYVDGEDKDMYVESVERTAICMGKKQETIKDVPCGNTVALFGLDEFITTGSATLTHEKETEAYPICGMKFSVSPVVRVIVQCKVESELPKLLKGLRSLAKSDPLVGYTHEESGDYTIGVVGEMNLAICSKDLAEDYMDGGEILVSKPYVLLYETVVEKSSHLVMTKSRNGNNQLFMKARSLDDSLGYAIEIGEVGPFDDPDVRGRILSEEYGLEKYLGKNIWCFGPETNGQNMVVDMCKEDKSLKEIEDYIVAGFQEASKKGALANEPMKCISFEVRDAVLHDDASHLDGSEMVEAAKRAIYASQLTAQPRFMQPYYVVEFQASSEEEVDKSCKLVRKRGGFVHEKKKVNRPGKMVYDIWAYVPVLKSFGFSADLEEATSVKLIPQCVFEFWSVMRSDPLEVGSYAHALMTQIRKRKGLNEQMTPLSDFEDKL
ncbi:unnamed protein product [Lactuca saligna]|uniref:Tr-type G domain-containing protein n=2 Tax=Lactuca TaxID=4235 RepID=A0AA36E023_LACSI|nr:unnamed protein product [Lactuca saligna]